MRMSVRSWATRSPETVRSDADWPTSVRSMLAAVGPSQSSDESPDAFRNGRMKSEDERVGTDADVAGERQSRRSRTRNPTAPRAMMTAIRGASKPAPRGRAARQDSVATAGCASGRYGDRSGCRHRGPGAHSRLTIAAERVEVCREVVSRLIPAGWVRIDTARHNRIERVRDAWHRPCAARAAPSSCARRARPSRFRCAPPGDGRSACPTGSARTRRCRPDDRPSRPAPARAPCTRACRRPFLQSCLHPVLKRDRAMPKSVMSA